MNENTLIERKIQLQEDEYRLPIHWLKRKAGLKIHNAKINLIIKAIEQAGNISGKILDLGCGDGRNTYDLQKYFGDKAQFIGIDFSERAIAFARLMAENIDFRVQNAKRTEFDEDFFDFVISIEVLEHIPPLEVDDFLREIHRVLKKDGIVLLTTPSVNRKLPAKHFQHFSPEVLHELLTKNGFNVVGVKGFGWWPPAIFESIYRYIIGLPMLWRLHSFFGTLELHPRYADDLIVVAKKLC